MADLSTFTADGAAALGGPAWLQASRAAAFERFASASLPTEAEEVWRYSRIADLDLDHYQPASQTDGTAGTWAQGDGPEIPAAVKPILDAIGGRSALIVTGTGGTGLIGPVADGVTIALAADEGEQVAPGQVSGEPDAFVMLNAAFVDRPLSVGVARGKVVVDPIVVVHWVDGEGAASFPRTVVTLAEGAEALVVEILASGDVAALVVPVTELDVAQGARLRHVTVQVLGPRVWQVGLQASRVGRDADCLSHTVAFGGDYARVRTDSTLVGPGGTSTLRAVYFGEGNQMHDFATLQSHLGKHTTSNLLFKGAVANSSHSVYRGIIQVQKGASGTNAFQTNRNLVLDDGAHADSVPTLEIEENDVSCSHASAVGPIDEEQRFYLESRAVPPEVADRLIVFGFLDDALEPVPVPSLLPWLRKTLAAKIAHAEARR
ncbi:MAG: Fe-S cluster assembly protein SufD [Actinomycetota bacterium]|nr:Fe-S cluster assembly protein SufD [Actinomycetota bacterium]